MYQQMIREQLAHLGRIGTNPVHIEAWMRLTYGTLDGLDWIVGFRRAVSEAADCVDAADGVTNVRLAESYGLRG